MAVYRPCQDCGKRCTGVRCQACYRAAMPKVKRVERTPAEVVSGLAGRIPRYRVASVAGLDGPGGTTYWVADNWSGGREVSRPAAGNLERVASEILADSLNEKHRAHQLEAGYDEAGEPLERVATAKAAG